MRIVQLFVAGLLLVASTALAQEAAVPAAPPASPGAPMDVVMTRDGGMVRGTLVESVPGQYAVITLATGETRRIEGAQIVYAGPATGAPQSAGPAAPAPVTAPAPSERRVTIRFESEQPRVTVHRVTGTSSATMSGGIVAQGMVGSFSGTAYGHSFARLCTAPCEMSLEPGEYHLALSTVGGTEVPAQALVLDRDGTVTSVYTDNSGLRAAGWVTFLTSLIGGAAIALVPMMVSIGNPSGFGAESWIGLGVGCGIMLIGGALIGPMLMNEGDGALVRFD